ncbi:MAG: 50S ribosomal protein L9 [Gammaproteobacteria bacterium RIFCSPHIGHO2_12_FULL_42_10]|nr:MAG: 50S ribosomal protein L9 [Gammaproteobacteria bacterium RIFCSPHIGHO2_12_FULL_42_10]
MEVILLEKIRHLGTLGDKVKVKPGFARNYLIPQSRAVYATAANLEKFEKRRVELEKIAAERHQRAVEKQQAIQAIPAVTIAAKASEEGKLFGSIGVREIIDALKKLNMDIEKRDIRLPHGLRSLGEYEVVVELDSDLTAQIKVIIVATG